MKSAEIMIMDNERIDQIIDKHQGEASSLIQVLLEIQSENHWLSKEILERVSERLQVPFSRTMHIASFYKAFSMLPKGRHECSEVSAQYGLSFVPIGEPFSEGG